MADQLNANRTKHADIFEALDKISEKYGVLTRPAGLALLRAGKAKIEEDPSFTDQFFPKTPL